MPPLPVIEFGRISDVTLGILEDNGVRNWVPQHELN